MASCRCQVRQDITRKRSGEVNSVEAPRFGPVVSYRAADQGLSQEEQGHHDDKDLTVARWLRVATPGSSGDGCARLSPSTRGTELAEGKENSGRSGQQGYQAQGTPEIGPRRSGVSHQRVVRKIVGVGIRPAGARATEAQAVQAKKAVSLPQLDRVLDILGRSEPPLEAGSDEIVRPPARPAFERTFLGHWKQQGPGSGVVAVFFEQLPGPRLQRPPFHREAGPGDSGRSASGPGRSRYPAARVCRYSAEKSGPR